MQQLTRYGKLFRVRLLVRLRHRSDMVARFPLAGNCGRQVFGTYSQILSLVSSLYGVELSRKNACTTATAAKDQIRCGSKFPFAGNCGRQVLKTFSQMLTLVLGDCMDRVEPLYRVPELFYLWYGTYPFVGWKIWPTVFNAYLFRKDGCEAVA